MIKMRLSPLPVPVVDSICTPRNPPSPIAIASTFPITHLQKHQVAPSGQISQALNRLRVALARIYALSSLHRFAIRHAPVGRNLVPVILDAELAVVGTVGAGEPDLFLGWEGGCEGGG